MLNVLRCSWGFATVGALGCCDTIQEPVSPALFLTHMHTSTLFLCSSGDKERERWGSVSVFGAWGEFQYVLLAERVVAENCCGRRWDAQIRLRLTAKCVESLWKDAS